MFLAFFCLAASVGCAFKINRYPHPGRFDHIGWCVASVLFLFAGVLIADAAGV